MKEKEGKKYNINLDESVEGDLSDIKEYLHEHTTKAFMQLATEALDEGEMEDSNFFLAMLAQESKYDIISCLWVIVFKINQYFQHIADGTNPTHELLKTLMRMVDSILVSYSVLIDEIKLDSANKFFSKDEKLLKKVILAIESGALDYENDSKTS